MRGTIEPVGVEGRQGRRGFGAMVAVGVEHGEDDCFAEVHRQVAEQMACAAVMMVGVFVTVMGALGTGVVVGIHAFVLRHEAVPVRGLPGSRLPRKGGRQHRREQDGDQQAGDGSRGAVHA